MQGPEAAEVMAADRCPSSAELGFMELRTFAAVRRRRCVVSRSGYTGEDGYEILVPGRASRRRLWDAAAGTNARVKPIGLGARDSLRLEAGLPLYGHDADEIDLAGRGGARTSRSPSAGARPATFRGAERIRARARRAS